MNHLFLDVHLGISHRGMQEALAAAGIKLSKGDTAVFLNRAWTGAKIMTHARAYIYAREPNGFTVETVAGVPRLCGGHAVALTSAQRSKMEKALLATVKRRPMPVAA